MMMPANFSAVSENEMTYVMGGSVADYLCPVMTKKEWSKFSTNLVTIIGNSYLNNFVGNTLGTIFSGSYVPGAVLSMFGSDISGIWAGNYVGANGTTKEKVLTGMKGVLNVGLNVVGNLAALYNLGFGTVKNAAEGAKISEFTAVDAL